MIVIGTINSPQEEQLVTSIAKFSEVGQRFREMGKQARLQNIKKHKVKKMNEDNQDNRVMRLDISDIFYVASMSKELGKLARKQSRK